MVSTAAFMTKIAITCAMLAVEIELSRFVTDLIARM